MVRESAPVKARRYLTEGRVIVSRVSSSLVVASCRGDGAIHRVTYTAGMWRCTCPVRTDQCAHLLAVRLVVAVDLQEVH